MGIKEDTQWSYTIEQQHTTPHAQLFGNRDIDLIRRMYWESMVATGVDVEYYQCRVSNDDLYRDPDCVWEEKQIVRAVFSDNPSVKVLKELGWYNEDDEIKAPIIYLPMYKDWVKKEVLYITDNSLIKLHYFGETSTADFRITDKRMDSVYGCYWVCKLSPERLISFERIQDNGSYFLKRNEDRDITDCEHQYAEDKETEENGGVPVDHKVFHHTDFSEYTKETKEGTDEEPTRKGSENSDAYDFSKW